MATSNQVMSSATNASHDGHLSDRDDTERWPEAETPPEILDNHV